MRPSGPTPQLACLPWMHEGFFLSSVPRTAGCGTHARLGGAGGFEFRPSWVLLTYSVVIQTRAYYPHPSPMPAQAQAQCRRPTPLPTGSLRPTTLTATTTHALLLLLLPTFIRGLQRVSWPCPTEQVEGGRGKGTAPHPLTSNPLASPAANPSIHLQFCPLANPPVISSLSTAGSISVCEQLAACMVNHMHASECLQCHASPSLGVLGRGRVDTPPCVRGRRWWLLSPSC